MKLPEVIFSFKENAVTKWNEKILKKTVETKKIVIIEDFNKIPLVSAPEKASLFFSFSNPIFSNDGDYALININLLGNLRNVGSDGYIMIFQKVNGKWGYVDKFTAYVS